MWAALGGIARATERLSVGTGVTCPIHPHAPGDRRPGGGDGGRHDARALLPGRGHRGEPERACHRAPGGRPSDVRREMLAEAVSVIRRLWRGGVSRIAGRTTPGLRATLHAAAAAAAARWPRAARAAPRLAGQIGDGFVTTDPDPRCFARSAGPAAAGSRASSSTVCWAKSERAGAPAAHESGRWRPSRACCSPRSPGPRTSRPRSSRSRRTRSGGGGLRPDPSRHLDGDPQGEPAGYDHVCFHQVGPEQEGFIRFSECRIRPRLRRAGASPRWVPAPRRRAA